MAVSGGERSELKNYGYFLQERVMVEKSWLFLPGNSYGRKKSVLADCFPPDSCRRENFSRPQDLVSIEPSATVKIILSTFHFL
jgi:hypothetical protein